MAASVYDTLQLPIKYYEHGEKYRNFTKYPFVEIL